MRKLILFILLIWISPLFGQDTTIVDYNIAKTQNGNKMSLRFKSGMNYMDKNGNYNNWDKKEIPIEITDSYGYKFESGYYNTWFGQDSLKWNFNSGGEYITWRAVNASKPTIVNKGGKVSYVDIWKNVTLTNEVFSNSFKEEIILRSPSAQKSFDFLYEFSSSPVMTERGIEVGNFLLPKMFAYDANGQYIGVTYSLGAPVKGFYPLNVTVHVDADSLSLVVYPVVIDPTITMPTTTTAIVDETTMKADDSDADWGTWDSPALGDQGHHGEMRSVIKWNNLLDSLTAQGVSSAEVDSATIALWMHNSSGASHGFQVSRVLLDWTEGNSTNQSTADAGECTWDAAQKGTQNWNTGGAKGSGSDISATYIDSAATAENTHLAWTWLQVGQYVKDAIDAGVDYGVVLYASTLYTGDALGFYSSENVDVNKPTLEVYWTEQAAGFVPDARYPVWEGTATPQVREGSSTPFVKE